MTKVTKLPEVEHYWVWKVPVVLDDGTTRLFTPWSDPRQYEYLFDFLFETRDKAYEGLDDWTARDDARSQGWVLCRYTLDPIEAYKPLRGQHA